MLKDIFINVICRYTSDEAVIGQLWTDIETAYQTGNRSYHNLDHLETIVCDLDKCSSYINDWDVVIFSTCYHDIVYNVLKNNNEELSANHARRKLSLANVPPAKIENCAAQITATKLHGKTGDTDTDIFTDTDLCILGKDWVAYSRYSAQVREEYNVYPGFVYNPGRKKVLIHFLQMERIFKTGYFFNLYESQARKNIHREIALL